MYIRIYICIHDIYWLGVGVRIPSFFGAAVTLLCFFFITPHRHWRWSLCDSLCLVLLCGGRYGLGSVVLLFILGSSLGGVGPVRGLRGGGRGGWCEEWARSG
jgi:hypothetical protein